MTITFDLERKDYLAFQVYAISHNRTVRMIYLGSFLLQFFNAYYPVFRMLTSGYATGLSNGEFLSYVLIPTTLDFFLTFAIVTGFILLINIVSMVFLSLKFKHGDGHLGRHMIELNETGLKEVTDVNESIHNWKSVQRFVDWKSYLLIYISPTNAHIIPKRAFASEADARTFLAEAKRLKENAGEFYSPSFLAVNS